MRRMSRIPYPTLTALLLALAPVLAVANGCGRLKPAAETMLDGGAEASTTPPAAPRCLLGSSPIATGSVCAVHPELCGDVCGDACVDLMTDGDNCGACGNKCKP